MKQQYSPIYCKHVFAFALRLRQKHNSTLSMFLIQIFNNLLIYKIDQINQILDELWRLCLWAQEKLRKKSEETSANFRSWSVQKRSWSDHFDSNRQISLVFDIILFNDKSYINNKPFGLVSINIFYFIVKSQKNPQKSFYNTEEEGYSRGAWYTISKIKHGVRN